MMKKPALNSHARYFIFQVFAFDKSPVFIHLVYLRFDVGSAGGKGKDAKKDDGTCKR